MTNYAETMGVVESDFNRVDFHELLDRQIIEYRKVVGYHRLEMSIEEGRMVTWSEAEREVSAGLHGKTGNVVAA